MQARKTRDVEDRNSLVLELNQTLMRKSKSDTNLSQKALKSPTPGRKGPIPPPISKKPSSPVQPPNNHLTSRTAVQHKLSLGHLSNGGIDEDDRVRIHPAVSKKMSVPARPKSDYLELVHQKSSLQNGGNDDGDYELIRPAVSKKPARPKSELIFHKLNGGNDEGDPAIICPTVSKKPLTPARPASEYLELIPHKLNGRNDEGDRVILPTIAKKPLIPTRLTSDRKPALHHRLSLENGGNDESNCMCSGFKWTQDSSTTVNMLAISWFHPNLTRHQSEAELGHSEEGVYLLRPRVENGKVVDGYALDVRSSHAVKHFKVNVQKDGSLLLGQERFNDLDSFVEHFDNHPMIGDETGPMLVCQFPYPREVDEIHDYNFMTNHFIPSKTRRMRIDDSMEKKLYSFASKEGYLVKLGQVVKNWKRRWFVLKNSEMTYYATQNNSKPIKTILLKDVSEVSPCEESFQRLNTFQIVVPYRTFYLQAPSPTVMDEWIQVLEFQLRQLKEADPQDLKQRKISMIVTPPRDRVVTA